MCCFYTSLSWRSLRTAQVGNPLGELMDSAHSYTRGCDLLPWEDTEQEQQEEQACRVKSGVTSHQLAARVLSQWSHTGRTELPQQWVVTTWMKCCPPGKLGAQGFLLGTSHMSILCLPRTKILNSQGKSRCSAHPRCWYSQAQGATLISSKSGGDSPEIQVPRRQPRADPGSRPFWGPPSQACYVTFFCTCS